MSTTNLAERILPARGAAQKASASFAEQLGDSPPSTSNPFGDPTPRTKSVKYRYSATGKHLSSPLKGSSSSPERKSKPATYTLAPPKSQPQPQPQPHSVASTSRKRKAPPPSLGKEDLLTSIFLSSPSPLSSAPTSPTVSAKDLPLSPPKRLPVSKSLSLRSLGQCNISSQPLTSKRKQTNANLVWDIGNSIWILVNQSGVPVDAPQDDSMWWPAQIVQNKPLRVSMFGDFPSSSSTSRGFCTIFAPSASNVQSIHDDSGARRFSRSTFRPTSSSDATPLSKKPRMDDDASIGARWESAVQSMEKASTLEKDGLPALLSSYATTGGSFYDSLDDSDPDLIDPRPKPKKPRTIESMKKLRPQRSKATLKDDVGATSRGWSPCPPDPTLQIPGELVLALAPKTGSSYWPAKILEHVPDRKEKYRVKFLDDEEHVIARDRFWTSEEKEFARCTLGEWESAVKTIEDPESGDDDEDDAGPDDAISGLPSPPEDFEDLSPRAQLTFVKPVLRAILVKEYAPAKAKHDAFMRGGSERAALLKSAGMRGGMDARFVKAIQKAICKWVLGSSGGEPERLDNGTNEIESPKVVPSDTRPREGDKIEGVEGTSEIPSHEPVDSQMAVDGHEQQPASPPPANGVTLSPAIQQASLAPKSQLDLLAEVSQAVATEPSLLPSHPPKSVVDIPRKDSSSPPSPLTPITDEVLNLPVSQAVSTEPSKPSSHLPKLVVDIARKDTSSPPSPLTPISEEVRDLPVCEEFETLSGVEKLDYCLNVLLPESIQQLLLWRSGERTSATLSSPEEEQRLHDVGVRKAAETDWVDDLMRLRAAQARLWGIDPNKKPEAAEGGTRSRPRRGTVSRP